MPEPKYDIATTSDELYEESKMQHLENVDAEYWEVRSKMDAYESMSLIDRLNFWLDVPMSKLKDALIIHNQVIKN